MVLTADLNVRDEQLRSMKVHRVEHHPEVYGSFEIGESKNHTFCPITLLQPKK